jgi:CubicO group peptidase (beta-lactamase class C family)
MQKKMAMLLAAAYFIITAVRAQIPNQQQFASQVDSFTRTLMTKIPIPAISITIVDERGTIFNKSYGWANKEAGIKADLNTGFYLASSTKSFTALTAALLDHEKKIMLDSPIKKYFPNIHFRADIGTDVTVRSLLVHTSGIVNSPLTFRMAYTGNIDREEMLNVLANATEVRTPPGTYFYDNVGYNIYGLALEESLHVKWQDELQEKIFTPLGMKRTTAYISVAKKNNWVIAETYDANGPGGIQKLNIVRGDNTMQSAGGLITTPSDIAIWLQAQINRGKINNRQVFPGEVMKMVHTGYAAIEKGSGVFSGPGQSALGWVVSQYNDETVIYKFGRIPGSMSHISFMPGKKIGVAIFMNEGSLGGPASDLIAAFIYDWITGVNVAERYRNKLEEFESNATSAMEQSQRSYADRAKRVSQLSMPLERYTGKYRHSNFGDIDVTVENNSLAVRMGSMYALSTPFTDRESIRVELPPGGGQVIFFKIDENGKVNSLRYAGAQYQRVR